jgi:hypothetical protein
MASSSSFVSYYHFCRLTDRISMPHKTLVLNTYGNFVGNRSLNCRVQCEGVICSLCASRRRCARCPRHLPDTRFEDETVSICKACRKRRSYLPNRTAVSGTVREHEIVTAENNHDLHIFLEVNGDEIRGLLEDAIETQE